MAQVINDPYSGNIFGRLGKGIGQGVSEQLPKEVQNYRESKALKESEGKSPIDQLSSLRRSGTSFGEASSLLPILNNQSVRKKFAEGTKEKASATSNKITLPEKKKEFATPEEISSYKNKLQQEPEQTEIDSLANKYLELDPNETVGGARNLAKQEIIQNRVAEQTKISNFRKGAGDRLALTLQGGGFGDYQDIAGEIQQQLLDQGELLIDKGMTPEAAAEKMEKIGLDLGKTVNKTKELGSFWNNLTKSSKSKAADLKAQKKDFEKYGFGEIFDDIATSSLGITPLQAAHVLDPLKNEEIEKEISKIKGSGRSQFGAPKELSEKSLDEVIHKIKPKDNLFAIEYLLRDKGISIDQFKNRLSELDSSDEVALTNKQRRQLQRTVKQDFLGDILFQTF